MQTRLQSLLEAWMNILIGYGIAFLSQVVVFPWFGIHVGVKQNIEIGLIFTVISLIRSYALRRFFNWLHG